MTTRLPSPLQTRVKFNEITFDIYAYRELTDKEATHAVALYIVERRTLVNGITYRVFSRLGQEAADAEARSQYRVVRSRFHSATRTPCFQKPVELRADEVVQTWRRTLQRRKRRYGVVANIA